MKSMNVRSKIRVAVVLLFLAGLLSCDFHKGEDSPSEEEAAAGVPTGLKVQMLSASEAMVSWNEVTDAISYEIYDGANIYTSAYPYKEIGSLTPGKPYTFTVRSNIGKCYQYSD